MSYIFHTHRIENTPCSEECQELVFVERDNIDVTFSELDRCLATVFSTFNDRRAF